jgi:hypothetical protein
MFQRATRLALVAFIFCSMGAHLVVIQAVAWATMAVTFSQHDNLGCSLQKTFDGHHPCGLCLKVKKASPSGPSLSGTRIENPFEAVMPESVCRIIRLDRTWAMAFLPTFSYAIAVSPDSPPPIELLS